MAVKKFAINFDDMIKKIKAQETSGKFSREIDETMYVPAFKDDGTHASIIRFLPSPDTDVPFVKKFNHGFQGPGGWFIEECPTSIGQKCPTCEANSAAWKSGDEAGKRDFKKKLSYFSNIYIIKDPQTPSNEGKVFKYRFGKKIYDKIMAQINPTDGISDPVMVFDWYEGANFKLSIKQIKIPNQKPQPNYDASMFAEKTAFEKGDDVKIADVISRCHPLSPLVSADKFKSYDELVEKMDKVMTGRKTFSPRTQSQQESGNVNIPHHENVPLTLAELDKDEDVEDNDFFTRLRNQK